MGDEVSSTSVVDADVRMPLAPAVRMWALVTGYVGTASSVALALFFALSDPYGAKLSRWFWLGSANDALGVVFATALIVAAVLLWRALAPSPTLAVLTLLLVLGNALGAVVTVLMLMGMVTLDAQFPVSIPTLVVMFAWFVMVGIRGARSGRLSRGLARAASVVGIAGVAGLLAFAIGLALPAGSPAQWAVFIIGGVPGGIAYLGLTVWWLVLAARGR